MQKHGHCLPSPLQVKVGISCRHGRPVRAVLEIKRQRSAKDSEGHFLVSFSLLINDGQCN